MSQQHVYRVTAADMAALGAAQLQVNALLPKGSRFTAEWGWNGVGRERFADKNGVDALYEKARAMAGDFYWESHTWDHRLLDNTTYQETTDEVALNQQQAPDLLAAQAMTRFSARSMITPAISGLFNGNALRALHDNGIENVVGDDSIAALNGPVVNQGLFTTMGLNGHAGIFIVPRYGLDIDFDASLPIECESKYNKKNRQRLMRNLTFGEVLDLNADRAARRLLAYRRDPYMFHQANVRSFQWPGGRGIAAGTQSLLSLWLNAVALRLGAVSTLPVVTWNHDEMALRYRAENERAACGVDGRMQLDANWNVVSIRVAAQKACVVPVTGLDDPGSGTVERYGPDVTTSVKVEPMARRLVLAVPLGWQ